MKYTKQKTNKNENLQTDCFIFFPRDWLLLGFLDILCSFFCLLNAFVDKSNTPKEKVTETRH